MVGHSGITPSKWLECFSPHTNTYRHSTCTCEITQSTGHAALRSWYHTLAGRCYTVVGGGFPGGLPPWLVVPVLRSCQSPIWIWLVNYMNLHLHLHCTWLCMSPGADSGQPVCQQQRLRCGQHLHEECAALHPAYAASVNEHVSAQSRIRETTVPTSHSAYAKSHRHLSHSPESLLIKPVRRFHSRRFPMQPQAATAAAPAPGHAHAYAGSGVTPRDQHSPGPPHSNEIFLLGNVYCFHVL